MKNALYFLIALLATTQTAFAALPPLTQSAAEIKAIVADPQLFQTLSQAALIQGIQRTEGGYLIQTSKGEVMVYVHYKPLKQPGPAQFELEFQVVQPSDKAIEGMQQLR